MIMTECGHKKLYAQIEESETFKKFGGGVNCPECGDGLLFIGEDLRNRLMQLNDDFKPFKTTDGMSIGHEVVEGTLHGVPIVKYSTVEIPEEEDE